MTEETNITFSYSPSVWNSVSFLNSIGDTVLELTFHDKFDVKLGKGVTMTKAAKHFVEQVKSYLDLENELRVKNG